MNKTIEEKLQASATGVADIELTDGKKIGTLHCFRTPDNNFSFMCIMPYEQLGFGDNNVPTVFFDGGKIVRKGLSNNIYELTPDLAKTVLGNTIREKLADLGQFISAEFDSLTVATRAQPIGIRGQRGPHNYMAASGILHVYE